MPFEKTLSKAAKQNQTDIVFSYLPSYIIYIKKKAKKHKGFEGNEAKTKKKKKKKKKKNETKKNPIPENNKKVHFPFVAFEN